MKNGRGGGLIARPIHFSLQSLNASVCTRSSVVIIYISFVYLHSARLLIHIPRFVRFSDDSLSLSLSLSTSSLNLSPSYRMKNDGGTMKRQGGEGFRETVRSPRNSEESQLTPAGSRDLRGGKDKQRHKRGGVEEEESRRRKRERKRERERKKVNILKAE